MFDGYSLLQSVLNMWKGNPEIFTRMKSGIETLRQAVESHRRIADQLTDEGAFAAAVGCKLSTHGLPESDGKLREFAAWIYESPARCPGLRLGYETTLALIENLGAVPKEGDFGDLYFVRAIPYVGAVTLDRRTRDICGRAVRKLRKQSNYLEYENRVFRNVGEVVDALSGGA
jgi:hypothetical protein